MTPEQLEAHRVRFEQQSGEPEAMKGQRRGDGYANHSDTRTWQAYQCGIADADRAQRAAPGVQGGKLPLITDDDRQFLHDNPNTQDVVEWVYAYALSAVAAYQEPQSRICAGPRCMYVPGRAGSMHSRECIEQAGLDQGWFPTATELENAGPSSAAQPPQQSAKPVEVQPTGWVRALNGKPDGVLYADQPSLHNYHSDWSTFPVYAAAQPVEVQRVPLTDEQIAVLMRPLYLSDVAAEMGLPDDIAAARLIEAEILKAHQQAIEAAVLAEREACAELANYGS